VESDDMDERERTVDTGFDRVGQSTGCQTELLAALKAVVKTPLERTREAIQEEERSRVIPAGVNRWVLSIQEQAAHVLGCMPCDHSNEDSFPGLTYVIQAVGGGLVKIGRAGTGKWKSALTRLGDVQSMSPVELEVVALVRDPKLERKYHVQFYRQRIHCEWFAPEVADWFRSQGAPGCVLCGKVRTP
jgi:hypothetical protein